MTYNWDENKRVSNLAKHGLDFEDAARVFEGQTLRFEDRRLDYGEKRWVSLGLLRERVVVIVHTERRGAIRIISMRKANKHEEEIFLKALG